MIAQEELKDLLKYDKHTGLFTWIQSTNRRIKKGSIAGSMDKRSRVTIIISRIHYSAHRLAWLYEYGYFPELGIDHIDRDPSNNSISNLRVVSQSCNLRNTANPCNNTSGVKGIDWNGKDNAWRARILSFFIGNFSSFDEAVCARLAAEQCMDWHGCDKNSPAKMYVDEMIKGV